MSENICCHGRKWKEGVRIRTLAKEQETKTHTTLGGGSVEKSCNTYNINIQQTTGVFRLEFLSPLLSSDSMWKYQIVAGHREYIRSAGSATRKWCCVLERNSEGKMKGEKLTNLEALLFREEGVKRHYLRNRGVLLAA
jgi:hypothetical protein